MTSLLRILSLALHLHAAAPELPVDVVLLQARHAAEAQTPALSAEVLLAVAYVESRYDVTAVSDPHHGWPRWCGVMQTTATTERECIEQRDVTIAYRTGVRELEVWWRYTRGDLTAMLAGYGCGVIGAQSKRCNGYPHRVQAFARRLASCC